VTRSQTVAIIGAGIGGLYLVAELGALSQESGSSEGDGQVNMSHGSAFVSAPSLAGRDHSVRDLALISASR
jgi:uncharacterized NAD(P)/FAD-binding protein YdhS